MTPLYTATRWHQLTAHHPDHARLTTWADQQRRNGETRHYIEGVLACAVDRVPVVEQLREVA